jgi:hypothetical protein
LDIVIRLESINQRTVRGKNNGDFATQRNVLVGGIIDQAGKKGSNRDQEAGPVVSTFFVSNG